METDDDESCCCCEMDDSEEGDEGSEEASDEDDDEEEEEDGDYNEEDGNDQVMETIDPRRRRSPAARCWSFIKKYYQIFQRAVKALVEHKYFQQGLLGAILINTLSMGIEYHNQVRYYFYHCLCICPGRLGESMKLGH